MTREELFAKQQKLARALVEGAETPPGFDASHLERARGSLMRKHELDSCKRDATTGAKRAEQLVALSKLDNGSEYREGTTTKPTAMPFYPGAARKFVRAARSWLHRCKDFIQRRKR